MLFKLIRTWLMRRRMYKYYNEIVVDRSHITAAVNYAKALILINEHWPDEFENATRSAHEYAVYMLGHYALNIAAQLGFNTFYNLFDAVKRDINTNMELTMNSLGRQMWEDSDKLIWGNIYTQLFKEVYGINDVPIKSVELTGRRSLNLISNEYSHNAILTYLLNRYTVEIGEQVSEYNNRTTIEEVATIKKRIKDLYGIAEWFKLKDLAHTLYLLNKFDESR